MQTKKRGGALPIGRPCKADVDRVRDYKVTVCFPQKIAERIRREAVEHGLTYSAYLRTTIIGLYAERDRQAGGARG